MKLSLVGLGQFTGHLPAEISGGMQKRAAIARAMALDPDDPVPRRAVRGSRSDHFCRARRADPAAADNLGVTFVIVTHELASIFAIADRVIMIDKRTKGIIAEGDPRRAARRERRSVGASVLPPGPEPVAEHRSA